MAEDRALAGKVAIISGAGKNIGRAIAFRLAADGAAVVVNGRGDRAIIETTAKEIGEAGGRAMPYLADVSKPDAVAAMVEAAVKEFGGVDIAVGNAGLRRQTSFLQMSLEEWHEILSVGDAVRHADQIGMQADRHDPAGLGTLGVERVELAADNLLELVDRAVAVIEVRRVVDLVGIGDRDQPLAADIHQIRLVVIDPVGDIETTLLGEEIERMPGLGEAGAEPAGGFLAGHLGDAGKGVGDRLALFVGAEGVEPNAVGPVVAEDLPTELDCGADDLRVVVADVAVQCRAGADAVLAQHIHQPPNADPVAVVALRPGPYRGCVAGRRAGLAGDAAGERKELDIGDDPDRDQSAVGPFELWPLVDRDIGKRTVIARLHGTTLQG